MAAKNWLIIAQLTMSHANIFVLMNNYRANALREFNCRDFFQLFIKIRTQTHKLWFLNYVNSIFKKLTHLRVKISTWTSSTIEIWIAKKLMRRLLIIFLISMENSTQLMSTYNHSFIIFFVWIAYFTLC